MALVISTQANSLGVANVASGTIVTDAGAAAAQTFTLGFAPRSIKLVNLTDRITDEWHEGMTAAQIYTNLVGINAKLDADAGVTDTNYGALWNPVAIVAGAGGPTSAVPYDVPGAPAYDLNIMRASVAGILNKLANDAGVAGTTVYTALIPAVATELALQTAINAMVAALDLDTGVTDTNYTALWSVSAALSLHTVAAGTVTYETTNGVNVVGNTFALTATTLAASKQFHWTALG